MLRIMLVYGLISGAIVIANIIIGYQLGFDGGHAGSEAVGYLIMLVALSVIFFAIKNYRDKNLGGVISFKTGAILGLGASFFAGLAYVAGWEAHLAMTDYIFIEQYTDHLIKMKEEAGVTGEALQKLITDMEAMKKNYGNPLYRMPMTFLEIFPVGVLVTLVSAALLRNEKFLPKR